MVDICNFIYLFFIYFVIVIKLIFNYYIFIIFMQTYYVTIFNLLPVLPNIPTKSHFVYLT